MSDTGSIAEWISIIVSVGCVSIPIIFSKAYRDFNKKRILFVIFLSVEILAGIIKFVIDKGGQDLYWTFLYIFSLCISVGFFIYAIMFSRENEEAKKNNQTLMVSFDNLNNGYKKLESENIELSSSFDLLQRIEQINMDLEIQITALLFYIKQGETKSIDSKFQKVFYAYIDEIYGILSHVSNQSSINVACLATKGSGDFKVLASKHIKINTIPLLERDLKWGQERTGITGISATYGNIIYYGDVSLSSEWIVINPKDKDEKKEGMFYSYPIINGVGVADGKCIAVVIIFSSHKHLFLQEFLDGLMEHFSYGIEQLIYIHDICERKNRSHIKRNRSTTNSVKPKVTSGH